MAVVHVAASDAHYHLVSQDTGRVIVSGRLLRHSDGTAWRLDRIHYNGHAHSVVVSRHTQVGRVRRIYRPEAFKCEVSTDAEWRIDAVRVRSFAHFWALNLVLLTIGGLIAWEISHVLGV